MLAHDAISQLPSVITCWQINTTETGFAGALTNVQEVNYSDTYVYVKTEDIPSWIPIVYDWPNNPWFAVPMNYQFRIRLNPTPASGNLTRTGYGHIGLWKNGCSIYNPKDAKSWQDSSIWFQNAWYWEHLIGETFDECIGHPNGSGEYHTHVSPTCLYDFQDSLVASPLLGYAFDSYPIYGAYGHVNPLDTSSEVVRLRSSYRLRNIGDRTTLPDGTTLPAHLHGPSLDSIPLGAYMEDYEYMPGLGDLDEHNGRFSITSDYPNGTYTYHTTIAWVSDVYGYGIKPVFPYVLGTSYYGRVYPADGNTGPNSGFVVIEEDVTPYQVVAISGEQHSSTFSIDVFPNPASSSFQVAMKSDEKHENAVCFLTDLSGKKIASFMLNSGSNYTMNAEQLSNGVYVLIVQSSTGTESFKLVISK